MNFPGRLLVIAIVAFNFSFIHPQNQETHQSYNFAKLVHDASTRLVKLNELKNALSGPEVNEFVDFLKKNLKPLVVDHLLKLGSGKCIIDLAYAYDNIGTPGGWAQQMIDAFGKPESGIFQGNVRWLGDYTECVQIYAPKGNGGFHASYCTVNVPVNVKNMTLPLSFGVCLPESCATYLEPLGIKPSVGLESLPGIDDVSKSMFGKVTHTCQPTSKKLTAAARGMIFVISVFIFLAVLGSSLTAYEYFAKQDSVDSSAKDSMTLNGDIERRSLHGDGDNEILITPKEPKSTLPDWLQQYKPFLNCFCVFTNGEKLLNTDSAEGQLPCLHGIRFLSLSWVIVCHVYAFCFGSINNTGNLGTYIDNWPFQIILNGFYSVDSFFLLSGFLVAYLYFQQVHKTNGKFPWIYFYVHRYIRLTPVYMIVLGYVAAIQPFMGSGPLWPTTTVDPICQKSWWWNLLYINNFQPSKEVCMAWSWYLANDMQFFVLSPIFLISLFRWPVIGWAIMGQFLLVTFVSNFVITNEYNLVAGLGYMASAGPKALTFLNSFMVFFDKIYIKPYARMSPYLVGIALAFYLYRRKLQNKGKNSYAVLAIGWIIATVVTLTCLFGQYHQEFSTLEAAFYNAFNRFCFACGLAWVMYVCITGQGSVVNDILSFRLFIPLSRLTYCAYLVHPIIMMGYFAAIKSFIHFSHMTMVLFFLGFLVMSYSAAFIVSLLFESPVIRLDKFVRTKSSKS